MLTVHAGDDEPLGLNLELCLGNSLVNPEIVTPFTRIGERSKDLIRDITEGLHDEREVNMLKNNIIAFPQIHVACNGGKHANDPCAVNVSAKTSVAVKMVQSVSDTPVLLSISTVDANKKAEQHVPVPQPARELHFQKHQPERKKRKVSIPEEKQSKLSEKSGKPFSGFPRYNKSFPSSCTRHFPKNAIRNHQKETATAESLLKGSSNASLTCQTLKGDKQAFLEEEAKRQFQESHRNVRKEQNRRASGNQRTLRSPPNEDMVTETCSDNRSSQLTEEQTKFEGAHWMQSNHELNRRNEEYKSDSFMEKEGLDVNASTEETDCKDPTPQKDVLSSSIRCQDFGKATVPSLPFTFLSLPSAAPSLIQNPFGVPLYVSNIGAVPYPVPYLLPQINPQPSGGHGESSFISYPPSVLSSSGMSCQTHTLTGLNSRTPILHPLPVRPSPTPISLRKTFPSSCQEETLSEVGATFSSHDTPKAPVISKPSQADASSESKGRSWIDQADSHALSSTSSGHQGTAGAASGPAHSGKSSSSGVYSSAHGESAESFPSSTKSGHSNHQPFQANNQGTATKAEGSDCIQATTVTAAPAGSPFTVAPLVSTTVDGNTTTGFLCTYSRNGVKICCSCHGHFMTAREFVVHAGGVDGPHPERSIVVGFPVSI